MTATDRAREIVADALGLDANDVSAEANMESVAVWDSLQHLSVVTALEAELDVELGPEQISQLNSIAAIAEFVASAGLVEKRAGQ